MNEENSKSLELYLLHEILKPDILQAKQYKPGVVINFRVMFSVGVSLR